MGSSYEDEEDEGYREKQRKLKPSSVIIIFVLSALISVAGGFVLMWWNIKYRSEDSELWMVPFGLILFLTPMVIWFSLLVSDLCVSSSKEDEKFIPRSNKVVHPIDDSVWDPNRWSEKVSFSS
ncbi:hypothetical protein QN277_023899 [Acacia crassicarpa]|uniref:Transmembrane protein n=1 Tax=Acacia crassicarpa TaxID=499986 RepID=A0AAE1JB21_9FABA|nr:hypothetical protein QN277_023899 [Acacia crassicarpa]